MDPQLKESFEQLLKTISVEQSITALNLAAYLLLGGAMSWYVRILYSKCGPSISDSDSASRVFPLLTLVTIAVIAVVKSSVSLALGLVGALSIVRFRAAIKEPEELVYLFLCIGVGLALGAGLPLLAISLLVVATIFILGVHFTSGSRRDGSLLLTITGDANRFGKEANPNALAAIEKTVKRFRMQRYDVGNGRGQVRVVVCESDPKEMAQWVLELRELLPDCEISYVSLNTV
jgi:Domain of unknown function (DUF4956)